MSLTVAKNRKIMLTCVFSFFALFCIAKNMDKGEGEKLAMLNEKYGLSAVESLNYNDENSTYLSYVFVPDALKANMLTDVFDMIKPKKELIVKLRDNETGNSFKESLENVFILELRTDADAQEIAEQYSTVDIVAYAEPNFTVTLSDEGDTRIIAATTKAASTSNVAATSKVASTSNVVVAVIDSGADTTHKALQGRTVAGYDFVSGDKIPEDNQGHGTHIAGIIAGNSSAKIMPLKFTNGKQGKVSDLAKAIKYAADNNADVINLSLGLNERSSLLVEAVNYAVKKGVPMAAAAGNYNTSDKYYPAAYDKVIAVTGLMKGGGKLPQSNYGTWVDYSVVAQDILSAAPGNKYAYATGTSQAVAIVSAKIAKIIDTQNTADLKSIIAALDKISTSATTKPTGKYAGLLGKVL
jgi:thermitase